MIIYLKDKEKFDIEDNSSSYDLACKIGIQKKVLASNINGTLTDLSKKLTPEDMVKLVTDSDPEGLAILRHSTAHVLAKAILEIDPKAKFAIGPAIENGFYYDFMSQKSFSIADLEMIEKKMNDIIKRDIPFTQFTIPKPDAVEYFKKRNQTYKIELINSIESAAVGVYKIDDFSDLCRGPHIPSTGYIPTDAFKLTSVAGAYWRGDSKNDMLQRIYGTVFPSKKELAIYLKMIEESQARDHRKLGPELDIFHIDDAAPGNVFWLKNGCVIFNLIKEYITKIIKKHDYFLVQTPQLMNQSLWETSGHWEKFQENMFIVKDDDNMMAIKPMNCPGHIVCYKTGSVKSYRDLPIRMAEFGLCHRNESSGALHGIMRLRAFMQDDGHVFCTPDQIITETLDVCSMLKEIYARFGFTDIKVKFSDRPEKRVGTDDIWDVAENSLMEAANAAGLDYTINKGEGAFYGPKLEFVLKDCLGRDWQCGTLQIDFNLPERFNIHYTDKHGNRQTPVMIHRAIIGSIERFIGVLIENYAGKFPFWLAPIQIAVASLTDESVDYAIEVSKMLESAEFRTLLDIENEKITYKVRAYSLKKIPEIIVVGRREVSDKTITIRSLGSDKTKTILLDEAIQYFKNLEEISK
ncbi:MAG: threonine--tRNA ligase [Holosporales bacterium]|jgi:threonyl-tRNA synthetase|nr:threonine--tRNA ligase [Holosporales bacterium]